MEHGVREYQFGNCRLNVLRRQLRNSRGELLELPARAFDALVFLVEHRLEVVSKDQIMKAVWPDTIVEENNLNQAIFALRRALGDSASESRFIMTLPGRGYRFIADVQDPVEKRPAPFWWVAGSVTILVLIGITTAALWRRGEDDENSRRSLAILPFKALLTDQSDPPLELGMTNSLINRMSGLSGVKVSSLNSVRRFADSDQDPLAAGKSLGVEAVLESSILRENERIRVTSRLLRVRDGQSLWAGKFDEPVSGILELQDSIALRVFQTIAPHLSATVPTRSARRTENAEAYQLYTKGFYNQLRRDTDGLPAAVDAYEAAILLDPGYVDAWGGLSRTLAAQGVFGTRPPSSVFPRAREAALKAVELDPESAAAHTALAHVLNVYDRQYKLAEEHYEIAIRLDPEVPEVYLLSSINQACLGHIDESLAQARHALGMEPASLLLRANLGMLLYFARSYDEAETQLKRVIALQPHFDNARNFLGRTLLAKGDTAGALEQFGARIHPTPGSYADPGRTYAQAGRSREARLEIERLRELGTQGFPVNYDIATIYAALGDRQHGCESLAAGLRDSSFTGLMQLDPGMDPLRTEPCFAEIAHQLYGDPRR